MAHSNAYQVPEGLVGLPVLISTPSDIGRLIRELERLDETLRQAELTGKHSDIKVSRLLQSTFDLNKLSVEDAKDRQKLADFLAEVKQRAPILHMSFSADPDVPFMEKLVSYLRKEIHPTVLVQVGLQPNMAAGCVVRSTNKYFDFSLRKAFEEGKEKLVEQLHAISEPQLPARERAVAPTAKEMHA